MTDLKPYKDFINSIMQKCEIIRTKTLVNCMVKNFLNLQRSMAKYIIKRVQNDIGYLLSEDGFVITRELYATLSGDIHFDNVDFSGDYSLKSGSLFISDPYYLAIMDCMCVVADFMPDSINFVMPLANYPWMIQFYLESKDTNRGLKVYQIMKVKSGLEIPYSLMLAGENFDKVGGAFKDTIRRIAIVEDEAAAFMIPHLGFSNIIMHDKTSPFEFKVIEKRTGEDLWSDYIDAKRKLEVIES